VTDFTWHCLQHTFASRLVMARVGLRTLQELMAHKNLAVTCRDAQLASQHQLDAVSRLDGWGREPSEPTGTKTGTSEFRGPETTPVENVQPVLQ